LGDGLVGRGILASRGASSVLEAFAYEHALIDEL
jgi:hypothetical protein